MNLSVVRGLWVRQKEGLSAISIGIEAIFRLSCLGQTPQAPNTTDLFVVQNFKRWG